MTMVQNDYAKGIIGTPTPAYAGGVVSHRFTYDVAAAGVALNTIIEMAPIPANCRTIDIILDADDLDTNGSPTIALDVGVMSGSWGENSASRTVGAEFLAASDVAQAGGIARPTLKTAFRVATSDSDRSIGVKIQAAAATPAAGVIGLTVLYSAAG